MKNCLDLCGLSYRMKVSFSLFWMIVNKAVANQLLSLLNRINLSKYKSYYANEFRNKSPLTYKAIYVSNYPLKEEVSILL